MNIIEGYRASKTFLKRVSWYGGARVPLCFRYLWQHINGPKDWVEPSVNSQIVASEIYFDPLNKIYMKTMVNTWPDFLDATGIWDLEQIGDVFDEVFAFFWKFRFCGYNVDLQAVDFIEQAELLLTCQYLLAFY